MHPNANDYIGKMVPVMENGVEVMKKVVGAKYVKVPAPVVTALEEATVSSWRDYLPRLSMPTMESFKGIEMNQTYMLIIGAALMLAVVAFYARKRLMNQKPGSSYNYSDLAGENPVSAVKTEAAPVAEDIESFKPVDLSELDNESGDVREALAGKSCEF